MKIFCVASLLCSSFLVGCGGGGAPLQEASVPRTPTSQPTPQVTLDENWHFDSLADSQFSIEAALGRDAGTVEGKAYINDSSQCFWVTNKAGTQMALASLAGTIDAQGEVSMKSESINGRILTITGTMAADGSSLTAAQYQISGCGDTKQGDLEARKYKPLTGTYLGVLVLNGENLNTTLEVTQAAKANVDSLSTNEAFSLTGTLTISGVHCSENWTLSHSDLLGNKLALQPADGPEGSINGSMDPDAMTLNLESYPYDDDCSVGASGTLQKQ